MDISVKNARTLQGAIVFGENTLFEKCSHRAGADGRMRIEVVLAGFLDPLHRLAGGRLEQHELLALVEFLLPLRPMLQHFVLLAEQLVEDDWKVQISELE